MTVKFNKKKPYSIVGGAFHGAQYQQGGFYFDTHYHHIKLPTDPKEAPAEEESAPATEVAMTGPDGKETQLSGLSPDQAAQVEALIAAMKAGKPFSTDMSDNQSNVAGPGANNVVDDDDGTVEPVDKNAPPPPLPPAPTDVKPVSAGNRVDEDEASTLDLVSYAKAELDPMPPFLQAKAAMKKQHGFVVQNGDDLRVRMLELKLVDRADVEPHMKNKEILG